VSVNNKMTVLYVDQAIAFGGSVVVVGYLVNALDKSRFRAVISGSMDSSILHHLANDNAEVYIANSDYNYAIWERTVSTINALPGRYFRKPLIYFFSIIRSLVNFIYIVRLARIIIKKNVDIVHVNNGMTNVEAIIAAILTGRKYIVHLHQIKQPGLFQRLLIKTTPKFIAISEFISTAMQENYIPKESIVVIPNPVAPRSLQLKRVADIKREHSIDSDDLVFGIVGRIVRWKGHEEFLKAAKVVLGVVPNSKALIVGDFSDGEAGYQDRIVSMVDEYGLKDRVVFAGYVRDVENMYSIMDVFVHASIEPEPFGLVITEAMSYGVAVIAADSGASGEIISEAESGYLVDPCDSQKLANKIITLLADDQLRLRIGEQGRQHTLRNYKVDHYTRAVEDVYLEVMGVTRNKKC
jgi:glycosyltransferase involved in cell wall biosynthesis